MTLQLNNKTLYTTLNYLIAAIWLVNGLACKVLHFVPRHEEIVGRILGSEYSASITLLIGISEIVMAIWILTKVQSKLNAVFQIAIIATMNTLEFILVPDLLLWGKLNSFFALLLIGCIYYNEFILNKNLKLQTTK